MTTSGGVTPRKDTAPVFKFHVEIEGIVVGMFRDCTGLTITREVEKIYEGGRNDYVHILPGRVTYSNLVLKRGISDDRSLWDWYCTGLYNGLITRKNVTIILYNVLGEVVRRWNVVGAFPVKWEGPALNAASNEAAIESLELAHGGITLAASS